MNFRQFNPVETNQTLSHSILSIYFQWIQGILKTNILGLSSQEYFKHQDCHHRNILYIRIVITGIFHTLGLSSQEYFIHQDCHHRNILYIRIVITGIFHTIGFSSQEYFKHQDCHHRNILYGKNGNKIFLQINPLKKINLLFKR